MERPGFSGRSGFPRRDKGKPTLKISNKKEIENIYECFYVRSIDENLFYPTYFLPVLTDTSFKRCKSSKCNDAFLILEKLKKFTELLKIPSNFKSKYFMTYYF